MTNPYDPQSPAKPNFFGGRKHILEIAIARIDKARTQKQSGGILAYGYRGVGKTSLLNKIRSMVLPASDQPFNNTLSIYRRLGKTTSDNELYQMITEDLMEEIRQKRDLIQKLKSVGGLISSAKLPILDIEFKIDQEWEKITPYHRWRSLVRNVENVDFILIAVDDADHLAPEALGELKSIVEEQNKTPIILVVSGGVQFEERLVDDYSPIARIFSGASFDIGEFTFEETKEVLQNPLVGQQTSWTEDGIKEIQKLSRGYPYLVQCLASASYAEGIAIDATRVRASLNAALDIGKPWLSHELSKASDNDIRSFLKIIESNKPVLKSSELGNLGVSPPYIGRLVSLKVIKKVSRGRYILIKPPIIAYYHSLKRDIRASSSESESSVSR